MNELKELQEIAFGILEETIRVCEKLEIPYFLTEGSCLGAVRHGDIIPWDDDIDIAIPADHYEKFVSEGQKLLKEGYYVRRGFVEDDLTRVVDKNVSIVSNISDDKEICNPWIDVMSLCGMPDNSIARWLHFWNIFVHVKLYKLSDRKKIINRKRTFLESAIVKIVSHVDIGIFLNKEKCLDRLKELLFRYDYRNCNYVYGYTSWYFKKEVMPKSVYGKGIKMRFGKLSVTVPEKYDVYLRRLYGNYKQLPPEEERIGKHKIMIVRK